jgi:tetratricopeptide (TPR) repeat protein
MRRSRRILPLVFLVCTLAAPLNPAAAQDIPEGSAEAISEFAQGMSLYTAQSYREALPHLYRAHELDNSFVMSLFFAALCEGNLGSGVPVDSLYRIVLAERHRLSPYYVHRAESQLAQSLGDRPLAYEHAWEAAELAPGSKAWYNVAYMAVRLNKPAEARTALLKLDPDKPPMKGWPGYWAVLGRANDALGRYEEVLQNAASLRKAFPDSRGPFWLEVNAYGAMGDVDGLNGVFKAAAAQPTTSVDYSVGALMTLAAAELGGHGHAQAGEAMYARAAAWYENAGDAVAGRYHRRWYALALMGADRFRDALEEADRGLGRYPNDPWLHGFSGMAASRMGDQSRFEKEKGWIVTEAANRVPPWLPNYMGYFLASEGRAEEAVDALKAGMRQGQPFSAWWHRDPAFDLIRDHPAFQELVRAKG